MIIYYKCVQLTFVFKKMKTLRESDSNANSAKSNAIEAQEMYAEQASQVIMHTKCNLNF